MRVFLCAMTFVLTAGALPGAGMAAAQEATMAELGWVEGVYVLRESGQPYTGTMVHHHPDGSVSGRTALKDGRYHGWDREWDADGTLRLEAYYENGEPDGVQRIFDHNGALMLEREWSAGRLEGDAVWYYPSGQVRWKTSYLAGERTGTWQQYSSEGELYMESDWEAGKLVDRRNPRMR